MFSSLRPTGRNDQFLDHVARAQTQGKAHRGQLTLEQKSGTDENFLVALVSLSPPGCIDESSKHRSIGKSSGPYGLLQQQNERQVNLKKQNHLKKLLEQVSKKQM